MRIITKARLFELAGNHPNSLPSVLQWISTVENAIWANFSDIRKTYNSADRVRLNSGRTVYVFDVRSYRLIAAIHFTSKNPSKGRLYVREFLTHAEYDKNRWKERNYAMKAVIESQIDIPKTYNELVAFFPPRPIHDGVARENTLKVIDALAGFTLNNEQEDYLDLLSTLVESYEADLLEDELSSLPTGIPMLQYLCKANGVSGAELGRIIGVGRAQASLILKGARGLTVAHMRKLSEYFKVSSALFV